MFKRTSVLLVAGLLALASVSTATAGNWNSGATKYSGTASGWASSKSEGGSLSNSQAIDNGAALNAASSLSTGTATATGAVSPTGAVANSDFTSTTVSGAGAWKTGNATGEASSGGGTDVSSGANSSFTTKAKGKSGFSGFSWR